MANTKTTTTQVNVCSLNGTQFKLRSLEGGSATANIAVNSNDDFIKSKHVSNIRYEDFVFDTGINDEIKRIIKGTWNDGTLYSDGSFITADASLKAAYEDEFGNALLTETIIPGCDATSKDAATFRLRFKPGRVENKPGNNSRLNVKPETKTKMLRSNFRFELGQLPCARVIAVDSFNVKMSIPEDSIGIFRDPQKDSASINFPNLFLTISTADLAPWFAYYKNALIDGHHLQSDELNGRLAFLAPSLKYREELFAISLQGVGIVSLRRHLGETSDGSSFRVELYCQKMEVE